MQVSITRASKMVGVTRATFYRHVQKKGISVQEDDDGNPKVDVSELIRVYGDKVKVDGHDSKEDSPDTDDTIQGEQDNTRPSGQGISVEIEILRERIDHLQYEREQSKEERTRERQLLMEQIDMLRERVIESEQQQKRLTLLLTSDKEKTDKQEDVEKRKIEILEETVQKLEKQNRHIVQELQDRKKPWWRRAKKSG